MEGWAINPYPGGPMAAELSVLKVIRTIFGAYGSTTTVLPGRVRTIWLSADHAAWQLRKSTPSATAATDLRMERRHGRF
jgi:hypothetical protein